MDAARLLLAICLLGLCWLGMQAVHELGHVLAARWSGGTVEYVALHPLSISYTQLSANPRPVVVAWAGPLVGVFVPLMLWGMLVVSKLPGSRLAQLFAGFCLIANGAYIGIGSVDHVGDAGELLRNGAAPWTLWLFGLASTVAGVWVWHRLGPRLGFAEERAGSWREALLALGVLLLVVAVEILAHRAG